MFSGIVEEVGKVKKLLDKGGEKEIEIELSKIDPNELKIGESIAVNGTCLTIISIQKDSFSVEASQETLNRTNLSLLGTNSLVNLERSLMVNDRFSGHIVTGHIDGIGMILSIESRAQSKEFWFRVPENLSKYIVEKGSIAVDGVSLTVNSVRGNDFSVNIIHHTYKVTTFSNMDESNEVNIECDIVGKYVERFVQRKD